MKDDNTLIAIEDIVSAWRALPESARERARADFALTIRTEREDVERQRKARLERRVEETTMTLKQVATTLCNPGLRLRRDSGCIDDALFSAARAYAKAFKDLSLDGHPKAEDKLEEVRARLRDWFVGPTPKFGSAPDAMAWLRTFAGVKS